MLNAKLQMLNKEKAAQNGKWKMGFTLIELLIVVAIIGVLAQTVIVFFPASQKRARDARRQSDITQYRTAAEKYANKNNGNYYVSGGTVNPASASVCTALLGTSNCAADPGTYTYQYNGTATQYVIWARLESSATSYFITCSNGKAGTAATVPSSPPICPL